MQIEVKYTKPTFHLTLSYEELAVLHCLIGNENTESIKDTLANYQNIAKVTPIELEASGYNNYNFYEKMEAALNSVKK